MAETMAASSGGTEHIRRRLAAILAADVAGYSRLMGLDEEGTTRRLIAARLVMDALIVRYDGRIANTAGDSILAEFASSVEAVRCAIDIQEALGSSDQDVAEDRRLQFRIGINVGDVIWRDGDLLGDGVNVASRLEGLAEPGGICLSGEVYDQIDGKLTIACVTMGAKRLKNIRRPVRTYRIVKTGSRGHIRPRHVAFYLAIGLMIALAAIVGLVWSDRLQRPAWNVVEDVEVDQATVESPVGSPTRSSAKEIKRVTWEGHEYLAMQAWGVQWHEADQAARDLGGYLVSINSADENAVVFELIREEPTMWVAYEDGQMFGPWIGMYQTPGSQEPDGGWTLASGESVTFFNWSRGQPNNYNGDSDYVWFHNYVQVPSPFWDDAPKSNSANGFVVEVSSPGRLLKE